MLFSLTIFATIINEKEKPLVISVGFLHASSSRCSNSGCVRNLHAIYKNNRYARKKHVVAHKRLYLLFVMVKKTFELSHGLLAI